MTDDIRSLSARLAEEPSSLAFLDLGETLRVRGQLDAALKIARGGLSRHPRLASAHDLLARILCDRDDLAGAFEAWADALRVDPMHPAALKGVAFLYFRAGDAVQARHYLERALEADPDDAAIPGAIARLGTAPLPQEPASAPSPERPAVETPDGRLDAGMLLIDGNGMRLDGTLRDAEQRDVSDAIAAELAGVAKEATRTARILDLGRWTSVAVETPDAHLVLVAPTAETVLLAARDAGVPMARLTLQAERAARAARLWLERGQ